ncbi:MAG: OmpA family protein [Syntrophobacteraceae bacterium]
MNGKWPVLLVLCALALSACAGIHDLPGLLNMLGPKEQGPAAGAEPAEGKPLTCVERQQLACRTRLGKVEGISIEPRQDCVAVSFRCDTLFERDTARIVPTVCGLDDLADILKDNSETSVKVDAHTDCTRSEEDNLVLSETQACAVKEALACRGVDVSRITARGWGESRPVASNATESGRRENRRVTITLLPARN